MKITQALLDTISEQAKASPRLRMNYDLRNSAEDKSQRMLNAVPFGQADSQFKSLKFKVVGQADGTPQGLRLKKLFSRSWESGGQELSYTLGTQYISLNKSHRWVA